MFFQKNYLNVVIIHFNYADEEYFFCRGDINFC
jgi:hypothetical protein